MDRRLAERLDHPAKAFLSDSVPVIYLGSNKPQEARDHFQGLREAKSNLIGFALFDRLEKELHTGSQLTECMWSRREIENYITTPSSLRAYVQQGLRQNDLIDEADRKNRMEILQQCVEELEQALRITNKPAPWSKDIKVTDDFLDPLFVNYYKRLGVPQQTYKRDYHGLADGIPIEEIPDEVSEVLGLLASVADKAAPHI